MNDHEHQWSTEPYMNQAWATYSKRDDNDEVFGCQGRVHYCTLQPCSVYLFVPHDNNLKAVEAEISKEQKN